MYVLRRRSEGEVDFNLFKFYFMGMKENENIEKVNIKRILVI